MDETVIRRRAPYVLTADSRPMLPRHARLRYDDSRARWVVLVPERVLAPDEIAVEVLGLCDGDRTVADMVGVLAEKYSADPVQILGDVLSMLQDLAEKGFLVEAGEKRS